MPREWQTASCFADAEPNGGQPQRLTSRQARSEPFYRKVHQVLENQQVIASVEEQDRLIDQLSESVRKRKLIPQRWSRNRDRNDIIGLIQLARGSGDQDEAIWRTFLAAHFGRSSADSSVENQIRSASMVLCAFGEEPVWTWKRISKNPSEFRKWLADHARDLKTLSYGNHRKFESKRPSGIWNVVDSFIRAATKYGGPTRLFAIDPPAPNSGENFKQLYERIKDSKLRRFGRTGRFDFLVLLNDLGLISAEPASCYLHGATGPRHGATQLWGERSVAELDDLAIELAKRSQISPIAVEDALCNWQKKSNR